MTATSCGGWPASGRCLRERGVAVSVGDEIDGAAALLLVDPEDRDEVRYALRTAMKVRRSDWDTFDELFKDFWAAEDPLAKPQSRPRERPSRPRSGRKRSDLPDGA